MSARKPGADPKTVKKDDMTVKNVDSNSNKAGDSSDGVNNASSHVSSQDFPGCLLTPIKEHIIHLTREMQWPASREHDYAKTPEKIIPRGSISDHITDISKTPKNKTSWKKLENKKLEQALLNCHSELFGMRDMLLCQGRMAVTQHYRELLSLQMSLVLEQQQQIQQKEAELVALRQEKQQLESRIERMDRRMSVMQRRSRLANGTEEDDDECVERCSSNDNRISSDHQKDDVTSNATESTVPKTVKSTNPTDAKLQLTANRPVAKRKLQTEVKKNPEKKRAKLQSSELRTALPYEGIEVNESKASSLQEEDKILIPSWRVLSPTATQCSKVKNEAKIEDLSDDAYLKRHRKYEESERKRKRWDLQRARTLIQHQYLLDRYKRIHERTLKPTGQKPPKPNTESFTPKPNRFMEIEISDTIPVTAFGCSVPYIEPREFELPWFNLDERDAKETIRTTRSRARASKSGSISSPPSASSTTLT